MSYNHHHYWIARDNEHWNEEVFLVLYQIFQLTSTESSKPLVPTITIAKRETREHRRDSC